MSVKTGWWNPAPFSSRSNFHYVGEDGRTLCRRWLYMGVGTVEEGHNDHPDNCMACRVKLAQRPSAPTSQPESGEGGSR